MLTQRALTTLSLIISNTGELRAKFRDCGDAKLIDFQKYFYGHCEDNFIPTFLNNPINLDCDVTIFEILQAFLPWKTSLGNIMQINIENYLAYLSAEQNSHEHAQPKWEKILLLNSSSITPMVKTSLLEDRPDNRSSEKKRERQYNGMYKTRNSHHHVIYFFGENNELCYFDGDPTIDVFTYKNVPVYIHPYKSTELKLVEAEKKAVSVYSLAENAQFTLLDLLICLGNLLYFYNPISPSHLAMNANGNTRNIIKNNISNNDLSEWELFLKEIN